MVPDDDDDDDSVVMIETQATERHSRSPTQVDYCKQMRTRTTPVHYTVDDDEMIHYTSYIVTHTR